MLAVALRGDTRDTQTYIEVFRASAQFPTDPMAYYAAMGMEWGYGLISWALNCLGLGPTSLFFLFSLGTFHFLNQAAQRVRLQLLDVAPFYLGSFFLLQQLMQIRQGFASVLVLSTIVLIGTPRARAWRTSAAMVGAISIHISSAPLMLGAQLLGRLRPPHTRARALLWVTAIAACTVLMARAVMSFEVVESLGRLSVYAFDEEYSDSRELLDAANLRALFLLALLLFCASAQLLRSRAYVLLLGLYAVHLGLRLGFYDFLILSGRLSTALGIVEVLLLPMLLHDRIRDPRLRALISLAYFATHAAATLLVQAPYLIHDYFAPLHAHHTTS